MSHEFVPVAIRGSCLVDDEDEWPSDPGYRVERALFGGIVGIPFVGSPTDPVRPEISRFTLYTKDGDLNMYKIDLKNCRFLATNSVRLISSCFENKKLRREEYDFRPVSK